MTSQINYDEAAAELTPGKVILYKKNYKEKSWSKLTSGSFLSIFWTSPNVLFKGLIVLNKLEFQTDTSCQSEDL